MGSKSFDLFVGNGVPRQDALKDLPTAPILARELGRYIASPELAEAVNISIALGQPLLVTGEPGCGKTRLAGAVAHELGLGEPLVFNTRSTSRAQDLLYQFDAVLRFYDIQMKSSRAEDPANYIRYGALGKAIRSDSRRVVLIDEIDKAPRDFPNDLLNELDRMIFIVSELTPEGLENNNAHIVQAKVRPIVIITSNNERQLPPPFLRRCVFHHILFPAKDKLKEIINERLGRHADGGLHLDPDLVTCAIDKFEEVRSLKGLSKKPATGELLAWVQILNQRQVKAGELKAKRLFELPAWQALLKDFEDYKCLQPA